MNLLDETIEELSANGKSLDDILWFGTNDFEIEGDIAKLFNIETSDEYDDFEIIFLLVVGDDFWLERVMDTSSNWSWWEYRHLIDKPKKKVKLKSVLYDRIKGDD